MFSRVFSSFFYLRPWSRTRSHHCRPRKQTFIVHKKLICARCDYFQKAFSSQFKESNGIMHLTEESPAVFTPFIHLLYWIHLPDISTSQHRTNLFNLYLFSEKICYTDLGNRTVDFLQLTPARDTSTGVTPALLSYTYANTPKGSSTRSYCISDFEYIMYKLYKDDPKKKTTIPGKNHLEEFAHACKDKLS